ncbi:MAG: rod shape-determining protein MreD, partial [Alphaproteobacteria bacterium]|nr:rod shape-determining protein MreD [Alphaproteobacteria bacterium]
LPIVTTIFMTMLGICVWPLPYLNIVMPSLAFIALFYWSAHRPDLFSSSFAFFIGLLTDLVGGGPVGVSALLFTAAHQIIWRQRGMFAGHSFFLLWGGFALAATFMMIAQWILIALYNWHFVPIFPALTQTLLSIALFPLPCWILIQFQRSITSPG